MLERVLFATTGGAWLLSALLFFVTKEPMPTWLITAVLVVSGLVFLWRALERDKPSATQETPPSVHPNRHFVLLSVTHSCHQPPLMFVGQETPDEEERSYAGYETDVLTCEKYSWGDVATYPFYEGESFQELVDKGIRKCAVDIADVESLGVWKHMVVRQTPYKKKRKKLVIHMEELSGLSTYYAEAYMRDLLIKNGFDLDGTIEQWDNPKDQSMVFEQEVRE